MRDAREIHDQDGEKRNATGMLCLSKHSRKETGGINERERKREKNGRDNEKELGAYMS